MERMELSQENDSFINGCQRPIFKALLLMLVFFGCCVTHS